MTVNVENIYRQMTKSARSWPEIARILRDLPEVHALGSDAHLFLNVHHYWEKELKDFQAKCEQWGVKID